MLIPVKKKLAACVPEGPTLRAVVSNFQLSSFGREKMKFLKLSQMNGLDKWFTKIYFSVHIDSYFSAGATILILPL